MLLHVSVVNSFLLMGSIPLCGCTIICLSIYLLMDICAISNLLKDIMNRAAMNILYMNRCVDIRFPFFGVNI